VTPAKTPQPVTPKKISSPLKKTPAKKTPSKITKNEKEVHIHISPKKTAPPMNVTRVVHHSTKGDKEIVYRSPAKPTKSGKIAKGEKKVVHIHHHRRDE
jgi:hypothetical protein